MFFQTFFPCFCLYFGLFLVVTLFKILFRSHSFFFLLSACCSSCSYYSYCSCFNGFSICFCYSKSYRYIYIYIYIDAHGFRWVHRFASLATIYVFEPSWGKSHTPDSIVMAPMSNSMILASRSSLEMPPPLALIRFCGMYWHRLKKVDAQISLHDSRQGTSRLRGWSNLGPKSDRVHTFWCGRWITHTGFSKSTGS